MYLYQEGGGNGLLSKTLAYKETFFWKGNRILSADKTVYDGYIRLGYKPENRSFAVAASMLRAVGINSVRLLTNNPKKIDDLKKLGLGVKRVGIHIKPTNPTMARHVGAKASQLGHLIPDKRSRKWRTR